MLIDALKSQHVIRCPGGVRACLLEGIVCEAACGKGLPLLKPYFVGCPTQYTGPCQDVRYAPILAASSY